MHPIPHYCSDDLQYPIALGRVTNPQSQGVDYDPLVDATTVITDGVTEILYTLGFVIVLECELFL